MHCSKSKISVESIRWPQTRFTSIENAKLPLLNILKTSSERADVPVDAAVWVTPLCGDGAVGGECLSTFTKSACYPYCLAVRQTTRFE